MRFLRVKIVLFSLADQFSKALLLNPLNVAIKVLWDDDIAQIGNQVRVNPHGLYQARVGRTKHINYFDAIRFNVEGAGILAEVQKDLQALLVDESLGEELAQLLILLVDYEQLYQLEHLHVHAWAALRLGNGAGDAVEDLEDLLGLRLIEACLLADQEEFDLVAQDSLQQICDRLEIARLVHFEILLVGIVLIV